jgi:hypothetical protein
MCNDTAPLASYPLGNTTFVGGMERACFQCQTECALNGLWFGDEAIFGLVYYMD